MVRSRIRTKGVVLSPHQRLIARQPSSPHHSCRGCPPSHATGINDDLLTELNWEREARLQLEAQLQDANHQSQSLTIECDNLQQQWTSPSSVDISLRSSINSLFNATSKLLLDSLQRNEPIHDVVRGGGGLEAVISRSRLRGAMNSFIINNEEVFSVASDFFQQKLYKELKYKFCPWICLQQLDLAATVGFRAYDTIHMIEFAEDENKKYRRGLFYSRHKLTRLCRQLETHGAELLPYTVPENAVKFDVAATMKFILRSHGLWDSVLNKWQVKLAAAIDGGDLSWNVTQVSARLNMIDSRAIEPISGGLLFGDSGHDKVQSKYNCYPLYIVKQRIIRTYIRLTFLSF